MPQRQVSTTHSMSTFTVSRERQKPASSIVKPTCMPKTKNAATNTQVVLIGLTASPPLTAKYGSGGVAGVSAGAAAGTASWAFTSPEENTSGAMRTANMINST